MGKNVFHPYESTHMLSINASYATELTGIHTTLSRYNAFATARYMYDGSRRLGLAVSVRPYHTTRRRRELAATTLLYSSSCELSQSMHNYSCCRLSQSAPAPH